MIIYQKPSIRTNEIEPFISQLQYLDCQTDISCSGNPADIGADCETGGDVSAVATFSDSNAPSDCTVEVNGVDASGCTTIIVNDPPGCPSGTVIVAVQCQTTNCSDTSNTFVLKCDGIQDVSCEWEVNKLD